MNNADLARQRARAHAKADRHRRYRNARIMTSWEVADHIAAGQQIKLRLGRAAADPPTIVGSQDGRGFAVAPVALVPGDIVSFDPQTRTLLVAETTPCDAPFAVGDRVAYVGPNPVMTARYERSDYRGEGVIEWCRPRKSIGFSPCGWVCQVYWPHAERRGCTRSGIGCRVYARYLAVYLRRVERATGLPLPLRRDEV